MYEINEMNTKKPKMEQYDVPLKINIWVREKCQRAQFEVIKKIKPKLIFLISDGGRNQSEKEIINRNRKMYEDEVDWECEVVKIYSDENQGIYTMGHKALQIVWSRVDRCVTLEDDIIPSESFFYFCREMLERYKDDERVGLVCGMNHLGVYNECTSDYFFAREGSIWGFAMWKRTFDHYFKPVSNDPYMLKLLREKTEPVNSHYWREILGFKDNEYFERHKASAEFYLGMTYFAQNQLRIIPKYNLVSNWGCTRNAAHSTDYELLPKAHKRLFYMKMYELEFPLKHPEYVIEDNSYNQVVKRILAVDMPVIQFARKMERWLLSIKHGVFLQEIKKYLDP